MKWDPRGYLKRRREKGEYRTGDKVRVVGHHLAAGATGRIRSPGMPMCDWIMNLDSTGEPMGIYESDMERVHWWKFWRSKRARDSWTGG